MSSLPLFALGNGDDKLLLEGNPNDSFGDVQINAGSGNDRVTVIGNERGNPVFCGSAAGAGQGTL